MIGSFQVETLVMYTNSPLGYPLVLELLLGNWDIYMFKTGTLNIPFMVVEMK